MPQWHVLYPFKCINVMSLLEQLNYPGGGSEEKWLCLYKSQSQKMFWARSTFLRSGGREPGRECSMQGGRQQGRQGRRQMVLQMPVMWLLKQTSEMSMTAVFSSCGRYRPTEVLFRVQLLEGVPQNTPLALSIDPTQCLQAKPAQPGRGTYLPWIWRVYNYTHGKCLEWVSSTL